MARGIRCGRCSRPILAGDAFQCTSCNTCHHGSCWISTPSCTCGCTTNQVVHVASNGEIQQRETSNSRRQVPGQTSHVSNGVLHIDDAEPRSQRGQRAVQRTDTAMGSNVELECSHCLLPIDTVNEPCPFCGHMPSGKSIIVMQNAPANFEDAPFGLRAVSAVLQASGVFNFFLAALCLIPLVAIGEAGALVAAGMCASFGYFAWRIGTDLLKKQKWAKTTLTILATLGLFGFPFFTIWGALTLWGLHSSSAQEYYDDSKLLIEQNNKDY